MDNGYSVYNRFIVIGSIALSMWLLFLILIAIIFIVITAVSYIYPSAMQYGLIFIFVLIVIGMVFTILVKVSLLLGREIVPAIKTRVLWLKYTAPVVRAIFKQLGLDYEKMVWSIISINNEFILNSIDRSTIKKFVIILPHCLQLESCGRKITTDIHNCARCGRCIVDPLIELSDRLSVDIFVATGGSVARRQIETSRPDLVVAVACERDLLSGISDILPLQAIGIINNRPEGPCINTTVDIDKIRSVIEKIRENTIQSDNAS